MIQGKVVFFDVKKGFGFIAPEDSKRDVFVHNIELKNSNLHNLTADDKVSFDTKESNGKIVACNINVVD